MIRQAGLNWPRDTAGWEVCAINRDCVDSVSLRGLGMSSRGAAVSSYLTAAAVFASAMTAWKAGLG